MDSYRGIYYRPLSIYTKPVLKVNSNGTITVKQLFKTTASVTVWLNTRWGHQHTCSRAGSGWVGLVPSRQVCQTTLGRATRPPAHCRWSPPRSPPPSTLPLPEHRSWVGSQNAPGSGARFVSLKTKQKNTNKQHTFRFEHEMPLIFPVIHVGTLTTVLALSKMQERRD